VTGSRPGPYRSALPAAQVAAAARDRGATVAVLSDATAPAEVYSALAGQLGFPDWFGHNLDALRDSLTDLSWLPPGEVVLVWDGPAALARSRPEAHRNLLAVLADVVAETATGPRPVHVVLTGS
jgi:RNAse (barnase) inhibitor barstar